MSTIVVSGLTCPACGVDWIVESNTTDNVQVLRIDESMLLQAYRMVRQQRAGTMYISFADGLVNKFDVCPNVGSAQAMNQALRAGGEVEVWPKKDSKDFTLRGHPAKL